MEKLTRSVGEGHGDRSRFATALIRLLDDTKFLTRDQWSRVLGVTTSAISQWVQDKTLPRPEVLRAITSVVKSRSKLPREFMDEFDQVATLPAGEVSPHGHRVANTTIHYSPGDTFSHYALMPILDAFLRNLSALPAGRQEDILTSASERCLDAEWDSPITSDQAETLSEEEQSLLCHQHKDADVRVVSCDELTGYLERYRGLHAVGDNVRLNLVGMFNTEPIEASQQEPLPTCVIVLWKLWEEESFESFPLDEMMFFLLRGNLRWTYEGATPVVLGAGNGENRRLWMRAARQDGTRTGLPRFRTETIGGEPAIGLAVLYARSGVKLRSRGGAQVELETQTWSKYETTQYWEAANENYGEWANQLPIVDPVPTDEGQLEQYIREHRTSDGMRHDVHDFARQAKQISDADFTSWQHQIPGVLESRIIKFSKDVDENEIWMGHHGGREIFIPLAGTFKYVVVVPDPSEVESLPRQCESFLPERRRRSLVKSTSYSNLPYPDVLLLDSNNWHGFSGVSGDSYCLHIRCRAWRHPQSGGANNLKSDAVRDAEFGTRKKALPRLAGLTFKQGVDRKSESANSQELEAMP